jgi:hypothetical protein
MSGLAFPKPVRREKEPKRLRQVSAKKAARIAAGEERAGLKRSFMKRRPPTPVVGEAAGRMEFARADVCVGLSAFPDHVCVGDMTASHERNPEGGMPTGTGRKEDARKTCGMCWALHLNEWTTNSGNFAGWTKAQRHEFMLANYTALNAKWDALPPAGREWWAGHAEVMRRRRAEALRAFA